MYRKWRPTSKWPEEISHTKRLTFLTANSPSKFKYCTVGLKFRKWQISYCSFLLSRDCSNRQMRKIVKVYTVVKWCIWGDNLDRRRGRYRCSCVASRQPALYPWILQHTAGTLPLDTAADSRHSPPGYCSRQPALYPWILQQRADTLPLDTASDSL